MTYTAVDCLGFAGGFTLGMVQAGFELVGKRELPGGFGVPNCEANRHLLGDRWRTEVGPGESWTPVDADVVFGNPPCSGFSVMTAKASRGVDAKVNACMWHFTEYVAKVNPSISIMESVRPAFTMGRGLMQSLRAMLEERTGERWNAHHVFQNAIDLGGAAQRPRYFFVLARVPFGVDYPRVHHPTLRDVIEDLEGLDDTWELQPYRRPPTWWSKQARSDAGVVDGHAGARSPYVIRAKQLLEYSDMDWPVGWPVAKVLKRYYDTHNETVPPLWEGQLKRLIDKEWFMGFTTMVRWDPDRAARVITGAALQSVLHPWLPRAITNREAARIMGFPDDWRLLALKGNAVSATHGKGITVQCGKWIGDWARRSLDGTPGPISGIECGDREFFITAPGSSSKVPGTVVERAVGEEQAA